LRKIDERLTYECACVIADHLKALYFLVADGAPPSGKGGRARIIKILIRRIITRQIVLGITSESFLPVVLDFISNIYFDKLQKPWVRERANSYYLSEFKRFTNTIKRGQCQVARFLLENNNHMLSGSQKLLLEKQWGLPSLLITKELKSEGSHVSELQ
jgi:alanyl-tRNA synthetase